MVDRLPDDLLAQGYASERENAHLNLKREVELATKQIDELARHLADNPSNTVFSGYARQLGATVAELLTRAGQLDMANRLAFLVPSPEDAGVEEER